MQLLSKFKCLFGQFRCPANCCQPHAGCSFSPAVSSSSYFLTKLTTTVVPGGASETTHVSPAPTIAIPATIAETTSVPLHSSPSSVDTLWWLIPVIVVVAVGLLVAAALFLQRRKSNTGEKLKHSSNNSELAEMQRYTDGPPSLANADYASVPNASSIAGFFDRFERNIFCRFQFSAVRFSTGTKNYVW